MKDVMLDLETLGTAPGSVILSIGAVAFDPETGELGPEFHVHVDSRISDYGLKVDVSTVVWWASQSDDARRRVFSPEGGGVDPGTAVDRFALYLEQFGAEVKVWGNGAAFDNVLLRCAIEATSRPVPWKHWNDRCYRTLKNLRRDVGVERVGTHHDALDDARTQALHACVIFKAMAADRHVLPVGPIFPPYPAPIETAAREAAVRAGEAP